jgi:hypothetical protein
LFQLVFGPCSIAHDINSSPSAFSARAIAVLARQSIRVETNNSDAGILVPVR